MEKKSLIDRMKESFKRLIKTDEKATKEIGQISAIRLIDAKLERYKEYGTGEWKLSQSYGVTCPYVLPKNMSLKQACYIISYLYNEIGERNRRAYRKSLATQDTAEVLDALVGWGFTKMSGYENGYLHTTVYDGDTNNNIRTNPRIEKINGVADLFRVEHGVQDFKRTALANRYFDWYSSNANEYDANRIITSLDGTNDRIR